MLAIGLLNYADDDGYFFADPKMVRNAIRPLDDDSGITTVGLRELSGIGYISIQNHTTHGPIGFIPSFSDHQVINKHKTSKIKELYDSGSDTVAIRDEYRLEGKGKERKGKEDTPSGDSPNVIFDYWNNSTTPKTIQARSTERIRAAKTRLNDPFFRDNWRTGIDMIPKCPFLMGQNERGWTADIDWFLSPKSLPKIIEGKYTPQQQVATSASQPQRTFID